LFGCQGRGRKRRKKKEASRIEGWAGEGGVVIPSLGKIKKSFEGKKS